MNHSISGSAFDSRQEWRAGTPCLIAAIVGYAVGFGLFFFTANLFIEPMRTEFSWSASEAAFAPLSAVIAALLFPVTGRLIDRFGPRPLAIIGLAGLAAQYLILAFADLNVTLLRLIAVLIGASAASAGAVTIGRGVASWFRINAGAAIGWAMSGATLGGALGVPLVGLMISHFGWRGAYVGMVGLIVVLGLPIVVLLFKMSSEAEAAKAVKTPDGVSPIAVPVRDPRFWLLTLSLAAAALPIGMLLNHLQPILLDQGLDASLTVALATVFAGAAFGGRILTGYLLDRLPPLAVATSCFVLAAIGAYLVFVSAWGDGAVPASAGLALVGLSYGAEANFAAYFVLRFFGLARFSLLFGIQSMLISLCIAVGGFATAVAADRLGSYADIATPVPLAFVCASALMAALIIVTSRRAPDLEEIREDRHAAAS
ncbi:MFS transporter [Sphingomonas sp. SRS2]|uniref:MFS transporter n=1 Tax=Sphingomonas sp. SRS2 TaxID=133190 RepID=UPI0006184240|nr:MFS transporter [Sphingomonas sp. SRS2]KKC26609.1 hypothetical protein WP12_07745 [Sphingomonas sp. SRS2]